MSVWMVVLAAGLASYLLRISMISSNKLRLPPSLDGSVALVAPAAFAALAVTSIAGLVLESGLVHGISGGALLAATPTVLAVTVAGLAVARFNRPYLAVLVGMPTFWVMTALTSL